MNGGDDLDRSPFHRTELPLSVKTLGFTARPSSSMAFPEGWVPLRPRIRQNCILFAMNAMTTIRVEASVRDRLAALAEAHGRSLGAELAAILDDLEWEAIEAGYRRLAGNPGELAAYLAEAEAFSRIDLHDLADTAAEEYPEYNGGVA